MFMSEDEPVLNQSGEKSVENRVFLGVKGGII